MSDKMDISARKAGELMINNHFQVPSFQRGYAWKRKQVIDLWSDLSSYVTQGNYFLGLVILSETDDKMEVIDGQQRLVTLTLMAKAIAVKARKLKDDEIAERLESTFLRSMNYNSREIEQRISFVDTDDNYTFRLIIDDKSAKATDSPFGNVSPRMLSSFRSLSRRVDEYIRENGPEMLGDLAEFITKKINFAVFTNFDKSSTFRIFEVVNARGSKLTEADLLKNFVLSEANGQEEKEKFFEDWKLLSKEFSSRDSDQNFELFIKHAMNVRFGHIQNKQLYAVLSSKEGGNHSPGSAEELLEILMARRELYHQIATPSAGGPLSGRPLEIFSAFNSLNLKSVRPILMALCDMDDQAYAVQGMEHLLNLVVRKMVVENIGVGRVEKQFCRAAVTISETGDWACLRQILADFHIDKDDFLKQLRIRPISQAILGFVRRSALQGTTTPDPRGNLHWICPPKPVWNSFSDNDIHLVKTVGNTMLATAKPKPSSPPGSWNDFKKEILEHADGDEIVVDMRDRETWDAEAVRLMADDIAEKAGEVWYPEK